MLNLSIYYWSIIVLIFVSVFIFSKNNYISNFAYFSVFLYLTLLSGFRYDVGTDFSNYLHYFYLIELGYDDVAEISFVYLFKFSQFIGLTEQFVFFVLALIISFGFISYFKYFCDKSGFLAIYLFFTVSIFYFASFNLVRQFTAVAIFLFSVRYIIERRMFKYILMILFSSSFHISALLMLPLYFVMNKNYNLKFYSLMFVIFLFSFQLIYMVGMKTPYFIYLERESVSSINKSSVMVFVTLSVFLFVFLCYQPKNNKSILINNMLFMSILMGVGLLFSSLPPMIFSRFNYFFSPALIISIVYFVNMFSFSKKIIMYSLILMFGFLYLFYTVEFNGIKHNIVPYNSIF